MDTENPNTAIGFESTSEPPSQKTTPTKRRRRKKDKKFEPNFNIPGVYKLILPEDIQDYVGCVVGDAVTSEKPWINIEKETIIDHIDQHAENSIFFPMKNDIQEYPGMEVLLGYIPDESKDYDEFYVCVTENAIHEVSYIIEKLKKIQENRLNNAINRKIKKWKGLGSEKEVDEAMVKYNRSLIEVEIESKYPILPFKVHFRLIKAQDLRDGYMELKPTDDSSNTIFRRRIDAMIQVAPSVYTNEAQTICTYPKNSYTQYEYELPQIPEGESEKILSKLNDLDSFCDILRVNGCIDLYANDYENLMVGHQPSLKVLLETPKQYLNCIDMNLCGGKMISSICFHPMWSGCILASYVETAPSFYLSKRITTDEVYKAIHDSNPVLLWSLTDDLKPKLILETPRPVYALSCCPYDENLVIGGCVNGQIILWDITNKLNHVEEEEILTVNQQHYRDYMFSLMNWMKNIFDLALVRPAAISDLKYSHKGSVNYITWLSPFHNVSKTGKIYELEDNTLNSLTFMTSSEDGTVMIWDLRKKPVMTPGGFKSIRKLKRLKKRPSALSVMESPYKILHLNLKPTYKINLIHPVELNRRLSISACHMYFFKTAYELVTNINTKKCKLSDRLIYKPILKYQASNTKQTFYAGTMDGDFIQGTWDGQEFDSGEIVNFENSAHANWGNYHDGPIVSVDYAAINDTILTVGGKMFALWRESFQNRPVLRRKSKAIYTYGCWFEFEKASLAFTRIDGYHEVWTLFYQSKLPIIVDLSSNGAISNLLAHPRKLKSNLIALCDYRGSLKFMYNKHQSPLIVKFKEEAMSEFITREIARKKDFLKWQQQWNERYEKRMKKEKTKSVVQITEVTETKKHEEKKKPPPKISAGQRYLETMQEEHKATEHERIKNIILMKKQLDTEDLLKKREPLRKLEEETEVKKRKQKLKIKESDNIFKRQVAMLFPDIVKVKPPPPPDPYADCYDDNLKKTSFDNYQPFAVSAQDYVEENPFEYNFNWISVLKDGRERRKKLDDSLDKDNHRFRFEVNKAAPQETDSIFAPEIVTQMPIEIESIDLMSTATEMLV